MLKYLISWMYAAALKIDLKLLIFLSPNKKEDGILTVVKEIEAERASERSGTKI